MTPRSRAPQVRALGPDDWELFRRVRLAALLDAPAAFGSRYVHWVDAEPGRWRARLTDVPLNLVLIQDGAPLAMVSGTAVEDGASELISLWVAPAARGAGRAETMIGLVADWARGEGADRLILSVKIDNEAARRAYLRAGFVLVGPSPEGSSEVLLSLDLAEKRSRVPKV